MIADYLTALPGVVVFGLTLGVWVPPAQTGADQDGPYNIYGAGTTGKLGDWVLGYLTASTIYAERILALGNRD
jgi:hypothetical protein